MKHSIFLVLFLCFFHIAIAQIKTPIAHAFRTYEAVKVDGLMQESDWQKAEILTNFRQNEPFFDAKTTFQTEVRLLYDDAALYVLAIMHDTNTDSLLLQLGNRDATLNADAFGIKFDTYNKQNDAYVFEVSASGVQTDYRDNDSKFNAVWESAVSINKDNWVVEMRIPFSAIRFPNNQKQVWRLQLYRNLRRKREWTQWALENRTSTNKKAYWGELHGIENINPPTRLSLSPYVTLHGEQYPYNLDNHSNFSQKISGGIDLKLGLGEGHTFDMTLLPDFSQVQSDNQIKNLSAFETVYDEKRPFFQESVDLFNKGSLFYSRRIGRIPINYNAVYNQLMPTEYIISNPYQSKLINASKFSGRDKKGLAIGVFNAITDNTYAHIGDSINGERRILTDPMTNYNILVVDKAFKNSSSVYAINTNVLRKGDFNTANVTGAGINLRNNKNTYVLNLSGAHSRIYKADFNLLNNGHYYYVNIGKIKGNFQFNVSRSVTDDTFDKNDMGLLHINNQTSHAINLNYNIYNPFYSFLSLRTRFTYNYNTHYTTHKPTANGFELFCLATTDKYLSLWANIYSGINKTYDYYEPRTLGRYYLVPVLKGFYLNFSSDYRKPFALDGGADISKASLYNSLNQVFYIQPIVRLNDRLSLNHRASFSSRNNNLGYAGKDIAGSVYFGRRYVQTVENTFSALYVFKNDLSFSLRGRYYWMYGKYNQFYELNTDGTLQHLPSFSLDKNFNFNSLNVDAVFNWQFAPGSNMSIIWKNALLEENNKIIYDFVDNFSQTLMLPQLNTLTLKILYYLDYVNVKKKLSKQRKIY